ncbi:hypothetical protein ACQUFY_07190 [Robbsia andropogonis]|uniref:hypothetical protein n=1 Tax=Robbsia andropogonis TaxID=28092 RepID=UPI003D22CE80
MASSPSPTASSGTSPAPGAPGAAHPPLTGGTLALGTIAVSLAVFMNVLDTSIASKRPPKASFVAT